MDFVSLLSSVPPSPLFFISSERGTRIDSIASRRFAALLRINLIRCTEKRNEDLLLSVINSIPIHIDVDSHYMWAQSCVAQNRSHQLLFPVLRTIHQTYWETDVLIHSTLNCRQSAPWQMDLLDYVSLQVEIRLSDKGSLFSFRCLVLLPRFVTVNVNDKLSDRDQQRMNVVPENQSRCESSFLFRQWSIENMSLTMSNERSNRCYLTTRRSD